MLPRDLRCTQIVGLHEAHIAGKMALRMLPGTTARVMERRRGWIFAAERPVVAEVSRG
jgi:hypothetical protein